MLSLKKNFLFIHIPKTGGNSIQEILKQYSEDTIMNNEKSLIKQNSENFEIKNPYYSSIKKHSTLMDYRKVMDSNTFNKIYKFTCIRNPWERMMSLYFYKNRRRGINQWDKSSFIKLVEVTQPAINYLVTRGRGRSRHLKNNSIIKLIISKKTEMDFIIRFESLQTDFNKICQKIGIPQTNLPHFNRNPSNNPSNNTTNNKTYLEYYDDELIKLVEQKFQEDIEYFGYTFFR